MKKLILSYGITRGTLTSRDVNVIEEVIDEEDNEGESKARN